MQSKLDEFAARMAAHSLYPTQLVADGKIHRFSTNGRSDDDAGWYVLHDDYPRAHGAFGCWRTLPDGVHVVLGEQPMGGWADTQERIAKQAEDRRLEKAEREARILACAKESGRIWRNADGVGLDHPYLQRKCIFKPTTVRVDETCRYVVVPMHDENMVIKQLQLIDANGVKRNLPGAPTTGLFHLIKCERPSTADYDEVAVCEGYATGYGFWSLNPGVNVFCSFGTANMVATTEAALRVFPGANVIIAADNDGPGLAAAEKAEAAAVRCGSCCASTQEAPTAGEDWGDAWVSQCEEGSR